MNSRYAGCKFRQPRRINGICALPFRCQNVALDQQPRPFGLSDLNVVEILLHLFGIGDASDGRAGLARIVLWPLSL